MDYLRKVEYEAYRTEDSDYTLMEDKMDSFYEKDRRIIKSGGVNLIGNILCIIVMNVIK